MNTLDKYKKILKSLTTHSENLHASYMHVVYTKTYELEKFIINEKIIRKNRAKLRMRK